MSFEAFMSLFTAIFAFMRSSDFTVGTVSVSIMDLFIWQLFASVAVSGVLYILKGE